MGWGFAVDFSHKAEKAGIKILLEEITKNLANV